MPATPPHPPAINLSFGTMPGGITRAGTPTEAQAIGILMQELLLGFHIPAPADLGFALLAENGECAAFAAPEAIGHRPPPN